MAEDLKWRFSEIMEDNKQRISRVCRAYASNKENQKDLFQEVTLNIWKSLPSFRHEARLETWVYRICINVCLQYAMKFSKLKKVNKNIEGIEIFDDDADLQDNLESREKTKMLYECISKLPGAEKSLILLYLEDLPYKIISDVTGLTENHVAVKLSRIKTKLFNCINN